MMAASPILNAFAKAAAQGRTALIPFIVAGDPDIATTREILKSLVAAGADCIELGIPYSDPLADGPSIVAAGQRALHNGVTMDAVIELVADVPVPVVLFTYANPVMQYGVEKIARALHAVGAAGMIIPDLPLEETVAIAAQLEPFAIEMPLLIAPTTRSERAARIVSASRGFVYLVSRLGVTGAGTSQQPDTALIEQHVTALRLMTTLPIAVGFGLSRRAQIQALNRFADGAIVGSALVDVIHQAGKTNAAEAAYDFMSDLFAGTLRG